jgi:tetratricopeptide (TPR) repeat protein
MLRIAVFFLITLLIIDLRAQSMDTELARIFKIQEQGISYFKNGNPEKAVPLLLESTKRLENKLGKKHLAVAAAYYILGGVYSDLQKDREALIYNEKALAIYEKTGHQYTENLLTSVSSGYQRLGDHKKAIPVLERLAAIKRDNFGYNSNEHGIVLNSIANAYQSLSENDKAAAIREDVLKILSSIFSEDNPNVISTYVNLSLDYMNLGRNDKALPIASKALDLNIKKYGQNHQETAISLSNLAMINQNLGNYSDVEDQFKKALSIIEKNFGPNHPNTAISLGNLALYYQNTGNFEKSIPLLENSFKISKLNFGEEAPQTADAMNNLAEGYAMVSLLDKALFLHENALNIREKTLGVNHPYTAISLNNLAVIWQKMGENKRAMPLVEKALKIQTDLLGSDHLQTISTLNNLGFLNDAMGNKQKALEIYEGVLEKRERILGNNHPDTIISINNIAVLYEGLGDYAKSEGLLEKCLETTRSTLGNDHPLTATSINNLAAVHQSKGNFHKAIDLYESALDISQKVLPPLHPDIAKRANNLACSYFAQGDFDKALPRFEAALNLYKQSLGENHQDIALVLNNLSSLSGYFGDYSKAVEYARQALEIREKRLNPDHPDVAQSLNTLAGAYFSAGDYFKALPFFERSLSIREKALGQNHPDTAANFNNMGLIHFRLKNLDLALEYNKKALSSHRNALGDTHPDTAIILNNLALTNMALGNYPAAIEFLNEAIEIKTKALGSDHPEKFASTVNLSEANYLKGDNKEAANNLIVAYQAKANEIQFILSMDEKTRLSWQAKYASLGLAPCVLEPTQLGAILLQQKGIILDSITEDRALARSSGDGTKSLVDLASVRSQLSKLAFSDKAENRKNVDELLTRASEIERELSKYSIASGRTRQSSQVHLDNVIPAISEGHVFLDFLTFEDIKLPAGEQTCYGVVLLTHQSAPEFVRIDNSANIDKAIDSMRSSTTTGAAGDLSEALEVLSEKLWEPIAKALPSNTHYLIIAPDGNLNFLSFAALLDSDKKFLVEKYDISYMASARDLVRETKPETVRTLRLFANPTFQHNTVQVEDMQFAMRSSEVDIFGQLQLPPLPGTEKESAEIQKIASAAGWNLQTFTCEQADEQTLRQTKKPGILHLATHGFYLNSFTPTPLDSRGMAVAGIEKPIPNSKGVDPMRASGIALAGAQSTLKSWSERKAPDPETDGVLTAEEVAALDLDGTWLVTLSACETGVGEARSGEGVLGLRRAFMMAGAENLLITLWPVSDQTTAEIMADFYREALKTGNAPGSLSKVQREWLVKLRKEKGLLEAVRDAGPFVMATIGKPLPPLPREPAKQESLLDKVSRKIEALIQSSKADIKNN